MCLEMNSDKNEFCIVSAIGYSEGSSQYRFIVGHCVINDHANYSITRYDNHMSRRIFPFPLFLLSAEKHNSD
jgi:hypothetical protein